MKKLIQPSRKLSPFAPHEHRRGAAMVEFAIMVPLFLLVTLGAFEMGNSLEVAMILQSSAREGGRLAAMDWEDVLLEDETPNQKIEKDIRNFLKANRIPSDDVVVSITFADGENAGDTIDLSDPDNKLKLAKISVALDYDRAYGYPSAYMSNTIITRSLVIRVGRVNLAN
jgi:hypothetical protein